MRSILLLPILLATLVGGRAAADPGFTPAQREDIVRIVREALKTDPTILRDAVTALQADNQARESADSVARIAASRQALVASPGDPVAGNPAGDVTLVEFYDPRCPYCRRMLPAIAAMLQKDPKLRLVYKDIPVLGPPSVTEARAILAAANQGAYARMQEALMRDPAQPSDAMIAQTARGLGLDAARLVADMGSPAVTRRIDVNLALARTLHVEGTPVWIIGDAFIPGAVDQAALEAAVAAARHKS